MRNGRNWSNRTEIPLSKPFGLLLIDRYAFSQFFVWMSTSNQM
jgi:hypothetical protein